MNNNTSAVPACIGMIMDGNRRWAHAHDVATIEGHKAGYEKLKEVVEWCKDSDVHHLVVYAFSTENWKRDDGEVQYLMDLMRMLLGEERTRMEEDGVAIHICGDLSRFPGDIQTAITSLHEDNPADASWHLWVAASYGGRAEIIAAVNTLAAQGRGPYTEDDVAAALTTKGMPDPDIIVRTGGEKRLSNFLPWQSTYAEFFFLDTQWPAFSRKEFDDILAAFAERKRNFGA